jgi:hypothetical protein
MGTKRKTLKKKTTTPLQRKLMQVQGENESILLANKMLVERDTDHLARIVKLETQVTRQNNQMERIITIHRLMLRKLNQKLDVNEIFKEFRATLFKQGPWSDRSCDR